jgi:hypothetical protein
MGYIDLAILLRNNFTVPNEMQNCISVDNGRLIIQQINMPSTCDHGRVGFKDLRSLNC